MGYLRKTWLLWLTPVVVTLGVTVTLLLLGRLGDLWVNPTAAARFLQHWIFVSDPLAAREVILNALQVLAGIFAIMITVVAIIVQLSATRYTSRVVDLFLADPFKVLIFFAYVVPLIYGYRLSNGLEPGKEELARVRGVRKSQAMLAGFFIRAGRPGLAKRIHDDMAGESREFLAGIRSELFGTQSREFWEIEDRGVSFYYVEEPHRESVNEFFAWLLGERPLPREITQSA